MEARASSSEPAPPRRKALRSVTLRQERYDIINYDLYKDIRGEWRWSLEAANDRKITDRGEGYKNKGDCAAAIELVKSSTAAPVHQK